MRTLSKPVNLFYIMTTTKSNSTTELNTVILRGIVDKLNRIDGLRLNMDGLEALREIRDAVENLSCEVIAYRMPIFEDSVYEL